METSTVRHELHDGLLDLYPLPHHIPDLVEHLQLYVRRNSLAERPTPASILRVIRAAAIQYALVTDGLMRDLDEDDVLILAGIDENHRTAWIFPIVQEVGGRVRKLESRFPLAVAMAKDVIDVMEG